MFQGCCEDAYKNASNIHQGYFQDAKTSDCLFLHFCDDILNNFIIWRQPHPFPFLNVKLKYPIFFTAKK